MVKAGKTDRQFDQHAQRAAAFGSDRETPVGRAEDGASLMLRIVSVGSAYRYRAHARGGSG